MNVARHLAAGADVWLNTPRRPMEASGTSGQKAGLNGALNFSILDGWWAEGYNSQNGWSIGDPTAEYTNEYDQNHADATSIYETLENEVIPLFYKRDARDLPRNWLKLIRESIRTIAPQFSASRMIKNYTNDLYIPSMGE
jgi:starch phosphorylase